MTMSGFTTSDEVRRYLGGIFETAFADAELGPKLAATGLVLKLAYTEPNATIIIDAPRQQVRVAQDGEQTDAAMTMSSDTGNEYWQGKVNLTFAIARGKVKVDGQVAKLLKLAPLSKKLFPVYVDRLRADGRQDLIVGG
jgi:putative sterol carrier protein